MTTTQELIERLRRIAMLESGNDVYLAENSVEWKAADTIEALGREVEQLRVQLAGCGVAAMQNTEDSKAHRFEKGAYGWSESYGDVCRAVDREIQHREDHGNACKTIAEMLAAAMGQIVGPNRGVVEDIADLKSERDQLSAQLEAQGEAVPPSYRSDYPTSATELRAENTKAKADERLYGVGFSVNGWHVPASMVACWGMSKATHPAPAAPGNFTVTNSSGYQFKAPDGIPAGASITRAEIHRGGRVEAVQMVEAAPIKLYGDKSEPDPTKRMMVDSQGRKYECMVGGINLCNFIGLEKLTTAGLSIHLSEEPENEQGQIRVRVEFREVDTAPAAPAVGERNPETEALRQAAHHARILACGAWSDCMQGGLEEFGNRCGTAQRAEQELVKAIDALAKHAALHPTQPKGEKA